MLNFIGYISNYWLDIYTKIVFLILQVMATFELCEGNLNYFVGIFVWLPKEKIFHCILIVKSNTFMCIFLLPRHSLSTFYFYNKIHASSFSITWIADNYPELFFPIYNLFSSCKFHFINVVKDNIAYKLYHQIGKYVVSLKNGYSTRGLLC